MTAWIVFRKELVDALRDHRTLFVVFLSSIAIGPLLLVALSALVGGAERRAELREAYVDGLQHAPTLVNYLQRQTYTLIPAPAEYEQKLRDNRLADPVLVIGPQFEAALARGEPPRVELVSSSANQRARGSEERLLRLLAGFRSEQATLRLVHRGVAPALLQVVDIQERDVANGAARAAQLTGIVPFFVLMAVLYGALSAALDTTAGERERGSLEPLLMNPAPGAALVVGKWGAVAVVGMLIAVLSCFSFLPGQWFMRSETLAAMFRYGVHEALMFVALLIPLAAALSAVLMAVAIRCRTVKEAQANNTVVILAVSMVPMVTVFNQSGEQSWHLWVPALGQVALMGRVLRGEALSAADVFTTLGVCAALAALAILFVARHLRQAAVR